MLERDALVSDHHGARWPLGEKEILHRHLGGKSEKIQGLRAGNKDVTVRSFREGLGDRFWRRRKSADPRMNSREFVDAMSQTANLAAALQPRKSLVNGGPSAKANKLPGCENPAGFPSMYFLLYGLGNICGHKTLPNCQK